MASISANGSRGHHKFTLNINETATSIANNTSTVSFNLQLSPIQNGWDWAISGISYKITINGTDYTGTIPSYNGSSTVTIKSGTQTIPHNTDGSKTLNYSFSITDSAGQSYTPGNASASGSLVLTKIARYTSIKAFSVSKRNETSVTFNWQTADTIDYVWFSKDNGSNWNSLDVADGTSGSFNVGSLTPNTKYNFKLRVRRKDSQLTTDSSVVSQTTYKIPTQSLNQKNETTIKVNWSIDSTADRIQYSKDNGKTWSTATTVNATNGNYTISGLNPNTTYSIKTKVRRASSQTSYDTASIRVTTLKVPTQTLNSKTETTIKINWSADTIVDGIWYSLNSGSWTWVKDPRATSGTYEITGLSANTKYNIKTRIKRLASQTSYDVSTLQVTTYDFPYCIKTPDFIIGKEMNITLYNPLKRNCTIKMLGADGSTIYNKDGWTGTTVGPWNTAGIIDNLYKSIPNNTNGIYKIVVTYGSSSKTKNGGTYKIIGNETPNFTSSQISYLDSNSTVVAITQNNQHIVRQQSNLKISYTAATPKNYATISKYEITFNGNTTTKTSATTIDYGKVNLSSSSSVTIKVTDSRGLTTKSTKSITILDWVLPTGVINAKRVNNYEDTTKIKVQWKFSSINGKNSIQEMKLRYKKVSTTTWSSYMNLSNNTEKSIIVDKLFQWNLQIVIRDKFGTTTYNLIIPKGMPIMFFDIEKLAVGVNCFPVNNESFCVNGSDFLEYEIVDEW